MSDNEKSAETNESEQADAPEQTQGPIAGHRLLELIQRRLKERGMAEKAVPGLLGVTGVYWTSLANGTRRLSGLPREKMKRLADWIGISVLQAYLLADLYELEDLFSSSTFDDDLHSTRVKMQADTAFAAFSPADDVWAATPRESKILIAILYERDCGRRLLRRAQLEAKNGAHHMGILEF